MTTRRDRPGIAVAPAEAIPVRILSILSPSIQDTRKFVSGVVSRGRAGAGLPPAKGWGQVEVAKSRRGRMELSKHDFSSRYMVRGLDAAPGARFPPVRKTFSSTAARASVKAFSQAGVDWELGILEKLGQRAISVECLENSTKSNGRIRYSILWPHRRFVN